jgi:hypothetical protein
MKLRDKIIGLLFAILVALGILWPFYRKNELNTNYVLLNCKIISKSSNYKSIESFDCQLIYKGSIKSVSANSGVKKKNIFVGKYFPMAYSPKLNMGQILITPKDFKDYNIPFPDSLNWVLEYRY